MILRINTPTDREAVKQCIDRLPDKPYIVEIKQKKVKRSLSQNALYWMQVNVLSKESGYTPNELHEILGELFLPKVEIKHKNTVVIRPMSTTLLTTAQFTDYLFHIQVFASEEFGVILPVPADLIFDQWVDYYSDKF